MRGAFSDYIVYADESGSPTLENPDPQYPLFVLALTVIKKRDYFERIVPTVQKLKFEFFGHDQIVFHERDIRRQSGAFSVFRGHDDARIAFLERINEIVAAAPMTLIIAAIRKQELVRKYDNPWSPYNIALSYCLERLAKFLKLSETEQTETHVVLEARGAQEDRELAKQFSYIAFGYDPLVRDKILKTGMTLTPIFSDKKSNSVGLQLADLVARPTGLKVLPPDQPNRAFECFKEKLFQGEIKCFP